MHVPDSASSSVPTDMDVSVEKGSANSKVRRRRRTWVRFFVDLVLYLVIYVVVAGVSIGPMFWVWFGAVYVDGPKWFARLYLPLAFLCEICPPLGWLINAWINWWIL